MCISGSSARSMSPDPYISIHMYLRILCKIHVSSLCLSNFISQGPLQDPCLRIHRLSIFISQDPLQDPCLRIHIPASICLRIHVSASLYLRILCKIHVSGSMSQHLSISGSSAGSMSLIHVLASTNMDSLQDPRLRIHVSASLNFMDSLQDPCLRIHVSASFSQDPLQDPCLRIHISASICISGSSGRSMSPDPSLSIFISQDPCLSIHMYLRILCEIHFSGSMSPIHVSASTYPDPLHDPRISIHVSASLSVDPLQDPYLSIHTCGPCTKSRRRAFFVALRRENTPIEILFSVSRRRNAHFDLPGRIFCGPAQAKRKF